jgi:uncharacterized protein (DUF1778 family)
MAASSPTARLRSETVNLRVTEHQKALIDSAAASLGRTRSEFMLDAACRAAETALLDQRFFALDEEEFEQFKTLLDDPPPLNPRLIQLLRTPAPWEK